MFWARSPGKSSVAPKMMSEIRKSVSTPSARRFAIMDHMSDIGTPQFRLCPLFLRLGPVGGERPRRRAPGPGSSDEPPALERAEPVERPVARDLLLVCDLVGHAHDVAREHRDDGAALVGADRLHLVIHLGALGFVEFGSRGEQKLVEARIVPE